MRSIPLIAVLALPTTSTAQKPDPVDLAEVLEPIRAQHDRPAVAGAILQGGVVTHLGAAGVRRLGDDEPVTADDVWHLGSCTKAMTATVFGQLVEEGTVTWEATLPELFPAIEVHEGLELVTLRDLLCHRSGLMRDAFVGDLWQRLGEWEGDVRDARTEIAQKVLPLRPALEPQMKFFYSNVGYMIAGGAMERLLDESWEATIRERLFEPLGMRTAGFGPVGDTDSLSQPRGHTAEGEPLEPTRAADNPPALGPAGTVHASLRDWAKFIDLHMRGARGEPDLLLTPATFAKLHEPGDKAGYALGWRVLPVTSWSKGPVFAHSGSNTYNFCLIWASPEDDVAVLATCNRGGDASISACNAVCLELLRTLGLL